MTAGNRWVAFDVGGTFVDVLSFDLRTGRVATTKHRSSPRMGAESVRVGLQDHLARVGADVADVSRLAHGTTLVTNLLVEGKAARVGVLTTRGFRDLLEIGRMRRPSLYDLNEDKTPPLATRLCRYEVIERLDARGNVLTALNEDDVVAAIEPLRSQGVEAVAVCFLHSYANPAHEQRAAALLERAGFSVSLSAEVSAEYGEFERFSTAVINATAVPPVQRYMRELERSLVRLNLDAPAANNAVQWRRHLGQGGRAFSRKAGELGPSSGGQGRGDPRSTGRLLQHRHLRHGRHQHRCRAGGRRRGGVRL